MKIFTISLGTLCFNKKALQKTDKVLTKTIIETEAERNAHALYYANFSTSWRQYSIFHLSIDLYFISCTYTLCFTLNYKTIII